VSRDPTKLYQMLVLRHWTSQIHSDLWLNQPLNFTGDQNVHNFDASLLVPPSFWIASI